MPITPAWTRRRQLCRPARRRRRGPHWRHTLPQASLVLLVLLVLIYSVRHGTLPSLSLLAGAVYWGGLNVVLLTGFVSRGWHGLELAWRAGRQVGTAAPLPAERPA